MECEAKSISPDTVPSYRALYYDLLQHISAYFLLGKYILSETVVPPPSVQLRESKPVRMANDTRTLPLSP